MYYNELLKSQKKQEETIKRFRAINCNFDELPRQINYSYDYLSDATTFLK